jgi:purine-nucleoside/S-methyl-5'-thioadenosine phosphorylase / adenosine deaminase
VSGPQPTTVDLGGGFVFLRRADGHAAIMAAGLANTGAVGMMSPADIDARDDVGLRQWLQWWAFPDHARLRRVNQVHGANVVAASSYNGAAPEADGLWTRDPADVLVIRAADCAPVWVVDPPHKTLALVHAGWRGVAAGIVERAIAVLESTGARRNDLHAAIGPHIGPCCFEVGPEVSALFIDDGAVGTAERLVVEHKRADGVSLDLGAAIVSRLLAGGVDTARVDSARACTRCHPDLLHSYRRNGTGGPLMAAIAAVLQ